MSTTFRKRLALITTVLAALVITLGAYTRLKDAGLGCPDWPGCYGFLYVPHSVQDQQVAALRFPDSPIETHKGWPEMIHRYFASVLGVFILIQATLAIRLKRKQSKPKLSQSHWRLSLFILFFVLLQGAFGMWTVTLKLWPQVVSAHLIGGFALLSLLFILTLRLNGHSTSEHLPDKAPKFFRWTLIGLILVAVQIFLGAWTASNYAALACPDLPLCQQQWLPEMDFVNGFNLLQAAGPSYLGGRLDNTARVAIHLTHRLGAVLVTIYLLGLLFYLFNRAKKLDILEAFRLPIYAVFSSLILQIALGISNVFWLFPLPVAVAHNAGGALLLLSVVYLNYRVYILESNKKVIV